MSPARWPAIDWYDTPRYYDLVFDVETAREADFLEQMHERHGRSRGRRCLEPACGSGRLVAEMAARGWRVRGFDASGPMLRYARERLRARGLTGHAQLVRDRLESFRVPGRFDLAHCLVSTFKYVLDAEGARSHLECVARALAPGGIYVLGLHLSEYGTTKRERERWVVEEGGTRVVCNIQSWPPERARRRERVRSRLVVTEDGETRRGETTWWFRTYDARELAQLLRSVPELEHVATHGFDYDDSHELDPAGPRLDLVLVLRRR